MLNIPKIRTFYKPNILQESILDFTFVISSFSNQIQDWQILKEAGTDYYRIIFTILRTYSKLVNNPIYMTKYNTKKADWLLF